MPVRLALPNPRADGAQHACNRRGRVSDPRMVYGRRPRGCNRALPLRADAERDVEAEEIGWPGGFMGAFERPLPGRDVSAFDEIYLVCSAFDDPAWFVPLKPGAIVPVGQPYDAEFVDLWDRRRKQRDSELRIAEAARAERARADHPGSEAGPS